MYVLCKLYNRNITIRLEDDLIYRFNIAKNVNEDQNGGAGIVNEINYIYVLFK